MGEDRDGQGEAVQVTEHLWIPMPDGVRLAARLWCPAGAKRAPVPALFEYIPYRKADMVRARDERNHPFLARHGYACLRVDMRGSGDSEGHMPDMYSDAELADARHVIEWIAAQPWCDGKVGMFGTSWGGTAALQANIDAPEALKAVIAVCATHDRYEDDIHHIGGSVLTDTFEWGATLPVILAAPPTPSVGDDWQSLWRRRLDTLTFPVEAWLREEGRGAYWRHGSVIHQAGRLSRPVLAVGGWTDRYSNSVMSLDAARADLVWGVVGPGGHHYPDHGTPGPAIGFQQLALDWWARWMKPDRANPDWPRLRVWLREFDPPADSPRVRNGRWVETGAPKTCTAARVLHLDGGALTPAAPAPATGWDVPFDLGVGRASGDTGYFGREGGLPLDQRDDDSRSLTFETAPFDQDFILYGAASMRLCLEGEPEGQVALRLNDVAPDGTSAPVGLAIRNLALDDDLDAPARALPPTDRSVEIPFPTTAYRFRKGHRLRLAVSSSYWPLVWPPAAPTAHRILQGALTLPVFRGDPPDLRQPFPVALDLPAVKSHETLAAPALERWQAEEDGVRITAWAQPFTEVRYRDTRTAFGFETRAEHRVSPDDPASATTRVWHRQRYRRPDGTAEVDCVLTAASDPVAYHVSGRLTVTWNGEAWFSREWAVAPPRRLG